MSLSSGPAKALSPEVEALLPTDEDVAFYRQHGWYLSKKVFSDEEIDAAVAGSQRYYAGERDFPPPHSFEPDGWKQGSRELLRKNDYASLQNRERSAHHQSSSLPAAVRRHATIAVARCHHTAKATSRA